MCIRDRFGHTQYNPPSRFSEDISEDLVEKRGVYGSYLNFDRETGSTSYSGHEEFFAEMVGHILKKKQTAAALDDEREYKAVTRRHLGQLTEKKSSGLDPSNLKPGDSVRHVRVGIGEIQHITAVSYTHLDVYKRQEEMDADKLTLELVYVF